MTLRADGIEALITHLQLHNGAPGAGYTANVVGPRVAATGEVGGNNTITKVGGWSGLTANQPVTHVSYWTASSGGTCLGGNATTGGDTAANAAGNYGASVTETLA